MMNDYKHLGLLAVSILAAGLLFITLTWSKSLHESFSQSIARQKKSIIYYIVLFAIVLGLLTPFFVGWFSSAFNLSIWFNILIVVSCVTQFACTFIPEIGGRWSMYHRLLAGISRALLIPALVLLLLSSAITLTERLLVFTGLCVMLIVTVIVLRFKGKPRYFLLLQVTYFMAFFIPVIALTYLQ